MKMKELFVAALIVFLALQLDAQVEWTQIDGPYSGDVSCYTSIGDTLICGTSYSGIYSSIDNGHSWAKIFEPKDGYLMSLYFYQSQLFASWNLGSYLSEDSGKNWKECYSLPGTVKFHYYNDILFAATLKGVFSFNNISKTWMKVNNGIPETSDNSRAIRSITSSGNRLFILTYNSDLYFSDDLGANWNKLPPAFEPKDNIIRYITSHSNTLYLINGADQSLYSSADMGYSWKHILNIGACYDFTWHNNYAYIPSVYGVYRFSPNDSRLKLYKGESFLSIFSKDSLLFASSLNGMYRFDQQKDSFILSNKGINSAIVNDLDIFKQSMISATNQGTYFTFDEGLNWNFVDETKDFRSLCITVHDSSLFIGTRNGIIATKDLKNWFHADNGLTSSLALVVMDMQTDTSKNIIYAGTQGGVYRSFDSGQSWKFVESPVADIYSIAVGNNMVLASSLSGLYALDESSDSFQLIGFENDQLAEIEIIDSVVYISMIWNESGTFRSDDFFKTWTRCSYYLVNDICKRGYQNLYAAGFGAIVYSNDNGITMDVVSETGVPIGPINCVLQSDTAFYAGTWGNSIYKRKYLNLTDISSESYKIGNSYIADIPQNTTFSTLLNNIDLAHGASLQLVKDFNKSLLYNSDPNVINLGDQLKIIAEDGVTSRVLNVASSTFVEESSFSFDNDFIFPNPASDIINLNALIPAESEIMIFDMNGKHVMSVNPVNQRIDISGLSNGVYFIKWLDGKYPHIHKFEKQ